MREILFRGKRIDNGELVYGNLDIDPDTKHCMITGYDYYTDSEGLQREPFMLAVDPETVGQLTGKKDKNGKEIYEGDVVNVNNVIGFNAQIIWFRESWMVQPLSRGGTDIRLSDYKDVDYEIIGNIYNNPDLLDK